MSWSAGTRGRRRVSLGRIASASKSTYRFRPTPAQLRNRLKFELSRPAEVLSYRPIWLLLYLTDACNLRCRMCPHHTPLEVEDFQYLKTKAYGKRGDAFDAVLDRFPEAMVVSLAGVGEPLVHPAFNDIVERLKRENRIIDVTTNGYLLKGARLQVLTEGRGVREVSVSLNGADPDEHRGITQRGGWTEVLDNVRALVDARRRTGWPQRIAVSQVCASDNVSRWREYVALAASLGVDRLYMHNVIDMNIEDPALGGLPPTPEIADAIAAVPRRRGTLEIIPPKLIDRFVPPPRCQWFFRNLAFDAAGNLGSCGRVMNPQASYGNVHDAEDVWNNEYMRTLRRTFLNPSGATLEACCRSCVENYD